MAWKITPKDLKATMHVVAHTDWYGATVLCAYLISMAYLSKSSCWLRDTSPAQPMARKLLWKVRLIFSTRANNCGSHVSCKDRKSKAEPLAVVLIA